MSRYSVERPGQDHQAAIEAVLHRAASDPEFRALALKDPHAAIRQETGVAVPESFTIRFFDAQGYDYAAALPAPVSAGEELSEADLEQAAGGSPCPACDACDLGDWSN